MDALEIGAVAIDHPHQIVVRAGQQMAFEDLGQVLHGLLETLQRSAALLVEQVTGQVRWRETVEWFAANGVSTLYEIGSGKVLTGLARRISKDVAGATVGTAEEIDAALAALNA